LLREPVVILIFISKDFFKDLIKWTRKIMTFKFKNLKFKFPTIKRGTMAIIGS